MTLTAGDMRYLTCELVDTTDGTTVLEWLASTRAERHPAALAEAQALLDWAWTHFGSRHGPAEDGGAWNHDLQVQVDADGWHTVALTFTCDDDFTQACLAAFGAADGD